MIAEVCFTVLGVTVVVIVELAVLIFGSSLLRELWRNAWRWPEAERIVFLQQWGDIWEARAEREGERAEAAEARFAELEAELKELEQYAKDVGTLADIFGKRAKVAEASAAELEEQKGGAYTERDKLVCALSKLFPSTLERHPESDTTWDDDWRWIVFINLPAGQASWHIRDSELAWFDHLDRHTGVAWDGHTTETKYDRLAKLKGENNGDMD